MPQVARRRTHKDPITVRTFENPDAYWAEVEQRRRYSIPHSDGTFFSDGSGYSNGPEADLHYEIIERLREVTLRLEQFLSDGLDTPNEPASNSNFIPYAAEIEADIRLTRNAMLELDDENVSAETLKGWLNTFTQLARKYVERAGALCGLFLENAAVEGGKTFGKTVVQAGGIAAALYFTGSDFHGIAIAIAAFLQIKK